MESEYIALSETATEAIWMKRLLESFGSEIDNMDVFEDNQSCIKLLKNPRQHQRSKHIDVKFHHTRELIEKGAINVEYIATEENIADLLTKHLQRTLLNKHREAMGVVRVDQYC